VAARDAATKVKEAWHLLEGEQQDAARRVAAVEATAADAATRATAAEEKATHLEAAAQEATRVDPPADLSRVRG